MGRHKKMCRKEFNKRRREKKSRRRDYKEQSDNKEEGSFIGSERDNNIYKDSDSESIIAANQDNREDYLATSDQKTEESNINNVEDRLCDEEESKGDLFLNKNDPKIIRLFEQPQPSKDPLWVNFFQFNRHRRKLLKMLRNPLGFKF